MSYINKKNEYIRVNGEKIAYRELNKGKSEKPLVMLVHLAATMDNWDPKFIDLVSEKQHIILIDLPGVGGSEGKVATTIPGMAQQAIAIIKELGYSKINLLGLSMGGMVAQEVTRLSNDLVEKLILVGTGPRDGEGINNVTSTTCKFMFKAGIHRVDPKRYIFYNHDNKGKEEANKVLDRLASRSKENADTEMKVPSFLRQLKAIKNWSTLGYDDLKFIKQPTLIVNGDKDLMVPTVNSYNMHQKIENSKLIIYPNAAHGSLFQYADEFSKELIEFLGE